MIIIMDLASFETGLRLYRAYLLYRYSCEPTVKGLRRGMDGGGGVSVGIWFGIAGKMGIAMSIDIIECKKRQWNFRIRPANPPAGGDPQSWT